MKTILIINTEYKEFGGEDANIVDEIDILSSNYKVKFVKFSNKNKLNIYHLISFIFGANPRSNKILRDSLDKFSPDMVYIHNIWFEAGFGLFNILEKMNIPVVIKVHNYRFDCSRYFHIKKHLKDNLNCKKCYMSINKNSIFNKYFPNSYIKSFISILFSKRYFKILKNENLTIACLTNYQKEYLIKLGIDKNKIKILNNPILNSENKLNIYNPKSEYVVYAGRIDLTKGVEELLFCWSSMNIQNLKLKIIGDGEKLVELKNKYPYSNIEFLGYLSNSETLEIISKARAVITATKMFEGQPRLLCEASSLGVPSIYPSFGGMDEFFPSNYLLNFEQYNYDDLKRKIMILMDPSLLKDISNQIINFLKINYSNNALLSKFDDIFES